MIQIKDLTFGYTKSKPLFSQMNLSVEGGNIYGLLGKNGAGKTTLLKLAAGLLFPEKGTVSVLGSEAGKRKVSALSGMYYLPEEIYLPRMSGKSYTKIFSPFYPGFSTEQYNRSLEEFELDEGETLTEMSYGQKKKFLLTFGMATNCTLMLFDEPTNGLDIPAKSKFRKLLASNLTDDASYIISTHQVRDVENLIDPVIILHNRKIVFQKNSFQIAQRLSVKLYKEQPAEGVLHAEKVLGGYAVLGERTDEEESHVDIELLFNAVIKNPHSVNRLFSKEAQNAAK